MSVSCADIVEVLTSKLIGAGFEFDDTDDLVQVMDALEHVRWKKHTPATPAEIQRARELYADEGFVDIDDDAGASPADDGGGTWVQAWVWLWMNI